MGKQVNFKDSDKELIEKSKNSKKLMDYHLLSLQYANYVTMHLKLKKSDIKKTNPKNQTKTNNQKEN